ncbi:putative NADH-flavin reductase [Priestia megaterium]|uniref:NAD(P)-dependent oxidoreductase n=1 Tax=Priestia megaterium TaxID=1404 RepID=UPI000BFA8A71|nr:NAD(P)-dependent oxidoreductase [Priestia megaterium]MCM3182065.1 NAD(P)-dependent oxidoreductase [Priestia megaterium]MCM3193998.1 NAD(P)-dependent oxidoreductase [Priestia megaterium]PFR94075.1 NADH-flavin reductase [Priestia megaterium]
MKIGVIGATGKAGQLIMEEAKQRGHEVTAIVRNASKLKNQTNVMEKDIFAITSTDIEQFDAVVDAFNAPPGSEQLHVESIQSLIKVFQGVQTRLAVVGGAGSLFVDSEKTTPLMSTEGFPAAYYPTASNMGKGLKELEKSTINWTYLSPAAFFDAEGARTGAYQLGKDHVITNSQNESYISYADYAIALIDELENENHVNERFAVVGEKA